MSKTNSGTQTIPRAMRVLNAKRSGMRNGESRWVNGAKITKVVLRGAVQLTAYVVKRDGVELGIRPSYRAATALAS